jgi:hypothetical protein
MNPSISVRTLLAPDIADPIAPVPPASEPGGYELLIDPGLLVRASDRAKDRGETIDDVIIRALQRFIDADPSASGTLQP